MNRQSRRKAIVVLVLFLAATCVARADEIDDFIRAEMQRQNIPGLSFAVIRDGNIIKAEGYGLANIKLKMPAQAGTIFKIASVSKQFIATGIMLLVQEGQLSLDDPISKYLEGTPPTWKGITIRHLLTHTSGIVREPPGFHPRKIQSDMDVIKTAYSLPLRFGPGEKWEYCNVGYFALAEVIHKVSGRPWTEYLNEKVFKPSGMNTTYPTNTKVELPNRAQGYVDNAKLLEADEWVALRPSGAFLSTVLDMAKWDAVLYTDKVLSESSRQAMWTPVKLNDGATYPYGFGWYVGSVRGRKLVHHGGGGPGARAWFARFVDDRLTVILLMNLDDVDPESIVHGVAAFYLRVPAVVPPSPQKSSGPPRGRLIVDGGGTSKEVREKFIELAGGVQARIVCFPTGASAIRFGEHGTILNPDRPRDRKEWLEYEAHLKEWFGVTDLVILHTRDRSEASSDEFVGPLRRATGVYLAPGNSGRYAAAYLDTRTQQELVALLDRGGVIFGSSAGAIIQGSFLVRGRPDKPLLMAPGQTTGFGFLRNVTINPHLTSAKRDAELINVVDGHPHTLGIGVDDEAALLVSGDIFEVIGTGRIAIYDNVRRAGSWFYWLEPGDRFDLAKWTALPRDRFFESNGIRIRYLEQGQGPPVVLIHGYTGNADRHWINPGVFADLAKDHRVIAMDCRGHGTSDKPTDPSAYGAEMGKDIVWLLDHLKIQRAHIVGFSIGAIIVGHLLTTDADRFLSATLVAHPAARTWTAKDEQEAEAYARDLESDTPFRLLILGIQPPGTPPPRDDEIRTLSQKLGAANDVRALAAFNRGRRGLVAPDAQLAAVRVPTLGIIGSADPSVAGMRDLQPCRKA